jgi:rod shape-determining protein MreC
MRDYLDTKPRRVQSNTPIHPVALGALLLFITGLLFILDYAGVLTPIRERATQLFNPVLATLNGAHDQTREWVSQVGSSSGLGATVEQQRKQIADLQATVVALQQVQVENNTLRKQLGISNQESWAKHMLPAEVVARSPDAVRRTMRIAVGSADGVTVGMAVIGQQGSSPPALVGVIEDVSDHMASVLLITDFGSQISARVIHGISSATGVVQGQWQQGSRLRLDQIPHDATFDADDAVVTAGLSQQLGVDLPLRAIPAGIPIGTVETTGAEGHTLTAELRPYVDPDQVRDVWVVLGPS